MRGARFGRLLNAPAPCIGDHSDLPKLDQLYARRLGSGALSTSELSDVDPSRTVSIGPATAGPSLLFRPSSLASRARIRAPDDERGPGRFTDAAATSESSRARHIRELTPAKTTPPPCPLLHPDLDRLNSEYAERLPCTYLHPTEPGPASDGPAHSQSCSPRNYARDPRAVPSGRLGGEEGSPAGAPSGPAPVLILCSTCRQPIRHNEILSISFCPIHGLSHPFTFIPLGQKRPRRA